MATQLPVVQPELPLARMPWRACLKQITGPTTWASDSLGLEWGLRVCISNRLLGLSPLPSFLLLEWVCSFSLMGNSVLKLTWCGPQGLKLTQSMVPVGPVNSHCHPCALNPQKHLSSVILLTFERELVIRVSPTLSFYDFENIALDNWSPLNLLALISFPPTF